MRLGNGKWRGEIRLSRDSKENAEEPPSTPVKLLHRSKCSDFRSNFFALDLDVLDGNRSTSSIDPSRRTTSRPYGV